VGGEYFNESIPYGIRYADFMFKLSEKFRTAVSVKYHAPGEELVPDQLISVQDDADLQVCGLCDQRAPGRGQQHHSSGSLCTWRQQQLLRAHVGGWSHLPSSS
jgi:hypothetical protein